MRKLMLLGVAAAASAFVAMAPATAAPVSPFGLGSIADMTTPTTEEAQYGYRRYVRCRWVLRRVYTYYGVRWVRRRVCY